MRNVEADRPAKRAAVPLRIKGWFACSSGAVGAVIGCLSGADSACAMAPCSLHDTVLKRKYRLNNHDCLYKPVAKQRDHTIFAAMHFTACLDRQGQPAPQKSAAVICARRLFSPNLGRPAESRTSPAFAAAQTHRPPMTQHQPLQATYATHSAGCSARRGVEEAANADVPEHGLEQVASRAAGHPMFRAISPLAAPLPRAANSSGDARPQAWHRFSFSSR